MLTATHLRDLYRVTLMLLAFILLVAVTGQLMVLAGQLALVTLGLSLGWANSRMTRDL